MGKQDEKNAVLISPSIYEKLERRLKGTGVTVSDYVNQMLGELVREGGSDRQMKVSKEDEKKMIESLKALGYLE